MRLRDRVEADVADTAGLDLNENLARAGFGFGDVCDDEGFAEVVEDGSFRGGGIPGSYSVSVIVTRSRVPVKALVPR